jgi:hypothetical protein
MHFSPTLAIPAFLTLANAEVIGKRALSGQATFYGGNVAGGACSFSTYTLPSNIFGTALSDSNWDSSANCGACVAVTGPDGNAITAMVPAPSFPFRALLILCPYRSLMNVPVVAPTTSISSPQHFPHSPILAQGSLMSHGLMLIAPSRRLCSYIKRKAYPYTGSVCKSSMPIKLSPSWKSAPMGEALGKERRGRLTTSLRTRVDLGPRLWISRLLVQMAM